MNSTASTSHALSQSAVPLAARMLLAAIFLVSGVGKAIDPAGTMAYIASAGLPAPSIVYAATLCVELGGGLLLLIGFAHVGPRPFLGCSQSLLLSSSTTRLAIRTSLSTS